MKKVIILSVLISLSACKQTDDKTKPDATQKPAEENPVTVDCTIYTRAKGTPEEKAAYLFSHFEDFCSQDLRSCVVNKHRIDKTAYNDAIAEYHKQYPNTEADYYPVTWYSLKKEIEVFESQISYNCYGKYLSFNFNANGSYTYKFVDRYTSTPSCYSLPLLNGIADELKLAPSDCFIFSKGRILVTGKGTNTYKDVIVFKVKDDYFDISDDPGKKKNNQPVEISPI